MLKEITVLIVKLIANGGFSGEKFAVMGCAIENIIMETSPFVFEKRVHRIYIRNKNN